MAGRRVSRRAGVARGGAPRTLRAFSTFTPPPPTATLANATSTQRNSNSPLRPSHARATPRPSAPPAIREPLTPVLNKVVYHLWPAPGVGTVGGALGEHGGERGSTITSD